MIIKGRSRDNAGQLADYLLDMGDNEAVELLESDYGTATPFEDALADMEALATVTRGQYGLYHAQISPEHTYSMDRDHWRLALDTLERELALTGQQRVAVLHTKHGFDHLHAVWARTDLNRGILVPDSFNYLAHERASRLLERDLGHTIVPGAHYDRGDTLRPEATMAEKETQQKLLTESADRVLATLVGDGLTNHEKLDLIEKHQLTANAFPGADRQSIAQTAMDLAARQAPANPSSIKHNLQAKGISAHQVDRLAARKDPARFAADASRLRASVSKEARAASLTERLTSTAAALDTAPDALRIRLDESMRKHQGQEWHGLDQMTETQFTRATGQLDHWQRRAEGDTPVAGREALESKVAEHLANDSNPFSPASQSRAHAMWFNEAGDADIMSESERKRFINWGVGVMAGGDPDELQRERQKQRLAEPSNDERAEANHDRVPPVMTAPPTVAPTRLVLTDPPAAPAATTAASLASEAYTPTADGTERLIIKGDHERIRASLKEHGFTNAKGDLVSRGRATSDGLVFSARHADRIAEARAAAAPAQTDPDIKARITAHAAQVAAESDVIRSAELNIAPTPAPETASPKQITPLTSEQVRQAISSGDVATLANGSLRHHNPDTLQTLASYAERFVREDNPEGRPALTPQANALRNAQRDLLVANAELDTTKRVRKQFHKDSPVISRYTRFLHKIDKGLEVEENVTRAERKVSRAKEALDNAQQQGTTPTTATAQKATAASDQRERQREAARTAMERIGQAAGRDARELEVGIKRALSSDMSIS